MTTVHSFASVSSAQASVLILGSMPGEKSLAVEQYYAHAQNAFWPIMSAIFDAPIETYAQKLALIRNNNLALWDVLKACIRQGSLDQAIDKNSIVPNDFTGFLREHLEIRHIVFNGGTAHDIFIRHVWKELSQVQQAHLTLHKLPSTSPAMASLTRAAKTQIWRETIRRAQALHNHRANGA